jgi:polyhydroxybutyrate depolymerase
MRKTIVIIFISFALKFKAQITLSDSIYVGNQYRTFLMYIPAIYNGSTPRPLIFNLHGYTSTSSAQQLYSNFYSIADTANFLMVFPQGTSNSGQPFWNAGINPGLVDDIGFLSALIDSIDLNYNIDLNCVYSTGMSNGGFMSYTLACELSNRIAAVASVTGSIFTTQSGPNCTPGRPIPVMQISGTADATVPYTGLSNMEPIDTVVSFWVNNNNCNSTPVFTQIPNINLFDGCTAEHYVYTGGTSNSSVELYKIINGGHTWPGAPISIGITNQDFNASAEIWRFFRKYKLNQLSASIENNKSNTSWQFYPNPSTDFLSVNSKIKTPSKISIYNTLGIKLFETHLVDEVTKINLTNLPNAIYYLNFENEGKQSQKIMVKN